MAGTFISHLFVATHTKIFCTGVAAGQPHLATVGSARARLQNNRTESIYICCPKNRVLLRDFGICLSLSFQGDDSILEQMKEHNPTRYGEYLERGVDLNKSIGRLTLLDDSL